MTSLSWFIVRRVAFGLFTLFVISLLVSVGVEALPGDLAHELLGQAASPETVAALRTQLGLDLPAHTRYLRWIWGILHGDFGVSLANEVPISRLIEERLGNTLFLAFVAALISIPMGLILGLVSAIYHGRPIDRTFSLMGLVLISLPEFFSGYLLIAILAINFMFLPAVSMAGGDASIVDRLKDIVLPALTLSFSVVAYVMRMTRAAVVSVLSAPYIEMAQLKGIKIASIVVRHALPNVFSPIINVIVINVAWLIVGVVVVEVVFAYPGLGQLMVDSVSKRDLPIVQACCMIFTSTYIILNLLADVLAIISNPRLRRRR